MTPRRIDHYWSEFFGLRPADFLRPGLRVLPHARLGDYGGAWIFQRGPSVMISVPPEWMERTAARAGTLALEGIQEDAAIRALFGEAVDRVIGPAFQGRLEPDRFRPAPSPHVRELTAADRPAFGAFLAECDPLSWEHRNLCLEDPEVFGYFEGAALAAACKNMLRAPDVADHGVLTHPAYRGRGHGKAVVSASIQYALDRDRLILYQTLVANTPAVGIARALGLEEYARHVAVRLRE